MFNLIRSKQKDETISYQTLYFKEPGTKPLKNVDLSKNNVFKISDFNLRDYNEWRNIYKELNNIPFYFEVWVMPTVFNFKLSESDILTKFKNEENVQLQTYLNVLTQNIPDKDILTKCLFLIVDKENSENVTDKFKKLSFSLRNVNSDEVKHITVS